MKNMLIFGGALAALIAVGAGFATNLKGGATNSPRALPTAHLGNTGGRAVAAKTMDAFTGIELTSLGSVRFRVGDEYSIASEDDSFNASAANVRGNMLVIGVPGDVVVTAPRLEDIRISGAGEITIEELPAGGDVRIDIKGMGGVKFEKPVDLDNLDVSISGTGEVKISGTADQLKLRIPGAGGLKADGLDGNRADVDLPGIGDSEIGRFQEIDVRQTGMGDLRYESDAHPKLSIDSPGPGDIVAR
jgi:hypothetical protein